MADYGKIKLIVLDVDGTMTNGSIYYNSNGEEIKQFNVKDGLGIKIALAAGLDVAIITGRRSSMVEKRAAELNISYLYTGVQTKLTALNQLLMETGVHYDEVYYIGDDLNDLQCMECVGLRGCPSDADESVKELCEIIADKAGGHGAVRDCIKRLLEERLEWDTYIKKNCIIYEKCVRKARYLESMKGGLTVEIVFLEESVQ